MNASSVLENELLALIVSNDVPAAQTIEVDLITH